MGSKKLKEISENEEMQNMDETAEQSDSMSINAEADVEAAMKALEDDTEFLDDSLGNEPEKVSKAEEMAEAGQSTMDVNGETISVSKGAAKRFAMFDDNGDGLFSKEEVDAIKDQIKKNNQTIGLKDDSNGSIRIDKEDGMRLDTFFDIPEEDFNRMVDAGEEIKTSLGKDGEDGVITYVEGLTNHYEGPLGSFDYNIKDWAIGYKTVYDEIGGESVSTEIPILRYVGDNANGAWSDIDIPEGVKSLDYTFEGHSEMENAPTIPNSVESMHCTFKGCTGLNRFEGDAKQNETGDGWTAALPWNWGSDFRMGGVCMLPDSVKDLSYCFEDCTNLREGFTNTSKATQLENMDGYAKGCGNLEAILDVSQAKFLPVSAQTDAYDGINTKMIKSIGGINIETDESKGGIEVEKNEEGEGENKKVTSVLKINGDYAGISMFANEGSVYQPGKNETNPYSVDERDKLNYVKALQDYRANDRMYLADPTAVANATNGMATTATYIDENGQTVHTTDPTQQNAEQAESGGLFGKGSFLGGIIGGDTGQIVQRLGLGFLEFKLLKTFVRNPLVALGITAGGQALGVLPGTIGGIGETLSMVGGLFGEESAIGGTFKTLGDKLSEFDGKVNDEASYMTKEEASDMNVIADAQQASEAQNNALSSSALGKLGDNMTKRGAYSAEYGTFQELAEVQEGYGVFNNVRMASEDSMAALSVAILSKVQKDGGELSEESKAEIAKTSKQILTSWSKYGDSALDSLRSTYGGDPEERTKGEAGLSKMMRAAVQPDIELIKGLNDKYGFLTEQDLTELDSLQFAGLEGVTFSTYEPGMNLAPQDDAYVVKYDAEGNLEEGIFEDYVPEEYDIDVFEEKAAGKHDIDVRTENYVSNFGDGASFADSMSGGEKEVSKAVQPAKATTTRVPQGVPEVQEEKDDELEM